LSLLYAPLTKISYSFPWGWLGPREEGKELDVMTGKNHGPSLALRNKGQGRFQVYRTIVLASYLELAGKDQEQQDSRREE
jgi:hypothetical protein